MQELKSALGALCNENLKRITLSNSADISVASKVSMRPVLLKGALFFQETLYLGPQVFHKNLTKEQAIERCMALMGGLFGQLEAEGILTESVHGRKAKESVRLIVLGGKKGSLRCTLKPMALEKSGPLSHNREKQYLLPEHTPVDFLVALGIQSKEGHVRKEKYHKFRQINRYLEFVEDVYEALPKDAPIHIVDFGCGKSYLTFALYAYLHETKQRQVSITGLDLKAGVIADCNALAEKLGYTGLHFQVGDIATFTGADKVDMVVSLHACDTATDYALEKAVSWGAKVILAVPCCQHELNGQMANALLEPILRYGIIKERMAALVTDALRADLLEQSGYDTQILEFIDLEHTPKNLLLRAVKKDKARAMQKKAVQTKQVEEFFHVSPTLESLLYKEGV